jgi:hypothetical protein
MVKREDKFYVFKKDDLDSVLQKNPLLQEYFQSMCTLVRLHRIALNKRPVNCYVVCNQDESYADAVWKIILDGEDKKLLR